MDEEAREWINKALYIQPKEEYFATQDRILSKRCSSSVNRSREGNP
jgi:hypothetical protein